MLSIRKISNRYQIIGTEFSAEIVFNARDRMDACTISKLPEDETVRLQMLVELKKIISENFGGKLCLSFDPKYHADIVKAGFVLPTKKDEKTNEVKVATNAIFTTRSDLIKAIAEMKKKEKVSSLLKSFEEKDSAFAILSRPEDYAKHPGIYKKVFDFKKLHAGFVLPQKIEDGIYGEDAEKMKVATVNHYTLLHKGEVIATKMLFSSADMLYDADIIVHTDLRNQGYCQALMVKAYEETLKTQKGLWIIKGGDGLKPNGIHLYQNVLKAKSVDENPAIAAENGFMICFMPAGKILAAEAKVTEVQKKEFNSALQHPAAFFSVPAHVSLENASADIHPAAYTPIKP